MWVIDMGLLGLSPKSVNPPFLTFRRKNRIFKTKKQAFIDIFWKFKTPDTPCPPGLGKSRLLHGRRVAYHINCDITITLIAICRMKCRLGARAMSQSPLSRKCLSSLRNSCCREMSVASTIERTRSANSENCESVRYLKVGGFRFAKWEIVGE